MGQAPRAIAAAPGATADSPAAAEPTFADPTTQVADPSGEARAEPVTGSRPEAPASTDPDPVEAAVPPVSRRPPSPIVWVRGGESVQIFDSPGGSPIGVQADETEFGSPSVFSVQRRTGRWLGVLTPLAANGRLGWIRADLGELNEGFVVHSIVVDLSDRSAALFAGEDRLHSWAVTVGAEPSTTPTGTFAVTDVFRGDLNPAYGCCAMALSATQPNLPAGWPGSDRIAFHGTGGPIGVAASLGCLRSADADMLKLLKTVPLGTPVKIRA